MCGIIGYINNGRKDKDTLKRMTDKIIHRGPDDEGMYQDEFISLGFRRLSIIDLGSGKQPLFNEDKSKVLIFNGEIYNYKTLREELIKCGHKFKTQSDSEVIIHGYEEYGESVAEKLRGMFAFAIYDKETKEIYGARDYFGIKPYYYYKKDDEFIFGSEIKSFLEHPEFKKVFNEDALESYLSFQYSSLEETFFKGVFKLLPGHYFKYKDGNLDIKRYWKMEFNPNDDEDLDYWVEKIKEQMKESVEAHKVSDVEVGSFLSSGIDSSYIVTLANVDKTFTVGFAEDEKYNEISYAKELSDSLKIENISKIITSEEFFKEFPLIQYHMDEPVADASAVALYFVAKLASEHVKVVLSGEGADELFAGYNIYKEPYEMQAYDKIPFFIRKIVGAFFSMLPEIRGINFLVRRGKRLEERFIGNAFIFEDKERKKILKIKTNAPKTSEVVKPYYDTTKEKDPTIKMQTVDINMWLVGDILQKSDKMSMANSLEVRVPFLDREVAKLAMQIPTKYKLANGTTKYALRKAAMEVLPRKWSEKKKLGFPVPIRVWMKQDEYYDLIKKEFESEVAEKFFDTKRIIKLLDEHKNGKKDNSRKIWTIYTFLVWYNDYFKES